MSKKLRKESIINGRATQLNPYWAVADPGFPQGRGANSKRSYYLAIFSQKLHEIERIWTWGGRPWHPS